MPTSVRSLPPATAAATVIFHCCYCHHCCCHPCVRQGRTVCLVGSWSIGAVCHGVMAEDVSRMLCLVFFSSSLPPSFLRPPILFNLGRLWTLPFLPHSHSYVFLLSFPIVTFFGHLPSEPNDTSHQNTITTTKFCTTHARGGIERGTTLGMEDAQHISFAIGVGFPAMQTAISIVIFLRVE